MPKIEHSGVWYSLEDVGAATPVDIVAAPGAGKAAKVLKAVVTVGTAAAGGKASIQDNNGAPVVFAKFGAAVEGTQTVDCVEGGGGSANRMTENKKLQVVFTGNTARYTIKVLVDIVPV